MNIGSKILLLFLLAMPLRLYADDKSGNLDLSSLSLAGIRVLPVAKRVKALNFRWETLRQKKEVRLTNYRDNVVIINFWTTWCPPCRAAMPAIESFSRELRGQKLVWLVVNSGEERLTVENYIKKHNYTFPVVLDSANYNAWQYGIQNLPATIIINKKGYIVALAAGSVDWRKRDILEALQKLLAE